jgi:hypothetical protein
MWESGENLTLITACVVLASGECENVVGGEQFGKTAVVCDKGCDNAEVSSDLNNVDLLVKEACIVV